jgi:hypothetical protein
MPKIIAICASVSFYKEVIQAKNTLMKMGLRVLVPDLANRMEQENNYEFMKYAEEFDSSNPTLKKGFIDAHFAKIEESDAVLILNYPKHNVDGYVGPNTLMEITAAYLNKKKIFLLNKPSTQLPAFGEIMALQPVVLDSDLTKVKTLL